jgi:nitroreductase
LNDLIKQILSRRSIRKYTPEPIKEEVINELLEAAMSAPSAGNEQPWQFVVINNRHILDEIPNIHPHSKMLREAPLAILVCGDIEKEAHRGYWMQDCAAAVENLLLAASAKGLGAVWLGVYPREDRVKGLRELLNIPHHVIPFALVSVGHPAEKKPPEDRFDKTKIHFNRW